MTTYANRDFVLAVIDMYKEFPCLWKLLIPITMIKNQKKFGVGTTFEFVLNN